MRFLRKLLLFISAAMVSCSDGIDPKGNIKEIIATDMGTLDQLRYLIVRSDYETLDDAIFQVGRVIGCSKSTIERVLNGTTIPTTIMQDKIYVSFLRTLDGESLESQDETLSFWDRYIPFWYDMPKDDSYTVTINPLYEELL